MKKKQYIIPTIYVKKLAMESVLQTISGGGGDGGNGSAESKSHSHIIDDNDDAIVNYSFDNATSEI